MRAILPEHPSARQFSLQHTDIVAALCGHAAAMPGALAFIETSDGKTREKSITYCSLHADAAALSRSLLRRARPGTAIDLVTTSGIEAAVAYYGCAMAGMSPVLIPMPEIAEEIDDYDGIVSELKRTMSGALVIVTDRAAEVLQGHPKRRIWLGRDPQLLSSLLEESPEESVDSIGIDPCMTGHILFTSGSTGTAKATRISRRSISFNAYYTAGSWLVDSSSCVAGFGAPFHSAGLMVGYIMPVVAGARAVLVSPACFGNDPGVLLRAISTFGITHLSGADSAFDRMLRSRQASASSRRSELTSLRMVVVGGEPLRAEILDRLAAEITGGTDNGVELRTAYGMTEATGLISSSNSFRPSTTEVDLDELGRGRAVKSAGGARRFIASAGVPDGGVQVAVVDEHDEVLKSGQIGRIAFSSPSLFDGYVGICDSSALTFSLSTAGGQRSDFFDTGDLGFVENGELYVVGRAKETVVTADRRIFSVDIEQLAMSADRKLKDKLVMAAEDPMSGDHPGMLLLLEVPITAPADEIATTIFQAVHHAYPDVPLRLAIVEPGSLPWIPTSSKKPRLQAAKAFENGQLPAYLKRYFPLHGDADKRDGSIP